MLHDICVRSSEDHPIFRRVETLGGAQAETPDFGVFPRLWSWVLVKGENAELESWLHATLESPLGAYYASRGTDLVSIATSKNALKQKDAIAAALRNERDALRNERDAMRHERDALRHERDAMRHERDSLRHERDTCS